MRIASSHYFPLGILIISLSSCATLFNKTSQQVTIRTNSPAKDITVNGEKYRVEDGEAILRATRNKEPLIIGLKSGDSLQQVIIKSHNSFPYVLDAYCTWGLSCFAERKNPKRYYHPKNIYLEQNEGKISVSRFPPMKKGTINLTLSIPYVNFFYARTTNSRSHDFGFLGLGGGLDFFYKNKTYLSLQGSAVIDHKAPVPVGVDYFGGYERTDNFFLSIRNNHVFNSIDIGYGFNFSRFSWLKTDTTSTTFQKNTNTLGLSLASHYRITNNFKLGFFYQPAIFSLDKGLHYDYQHLFSLELLFTFRVRKGR